jgi:hypothetical protein
MSRAAEFIGNLQIRRLILVGHSQDKPSTKDQGLGRGVSAHESLQSIFGVSAEEHGWRNGDWHGEHPCRRAKIVRQYNVDALFFLGHLGLRVHL